MTQIVCANCGQALRPTDKFCYNCGAKVQPIKMTTEVEKAVPKPEPVKPAPVRHGNLLSTALFGYGRLGPLP